MAVDIIRIADLTDERLQAYTKLTERELRCVLEPEKGIFIAESPKVINVASNVPSMRAMSRLAFFWARSGLSFSGPCSHAFMLGAEHRPFLPSWRRWTSWKSLRGST